MLSRKDSIKKAAHIADLVAESIRAFLRPGMSEKFVASEIRRLIKKYGGRKESFRIIVSSGPRSSMVHGYATKKKLSPGEPVIVDFGAVYNGYCSDITRTFTVPGKMKRPYAEAYGKRFKKVYSIVRKAQNKAIKAVKHGVLCSAVDKAVRKTFKKYRIEKYFPHSTGHGIGIKVHEPPRLSYKSAERLRSGMIVTVEPGLYFGKRSGWAGKYPFGIRIEDMVLVTRDGSRLLTRAQK